MAGIDNNTVLYLRGDSFNDLSPNPKTIVNNGVTVSNNQLEFNKSESDSLYLDSLYNFTNSTPFTVEFNLNLSSILDTSQHILINAIDSERTHSVSVLIKSDKIAICLGSNKINTTSGRDLFSSTKTLAINTWYHIAVTYDGINNIKVYIDGVCTDTFTRTKDIVTLDNNWCIGNNEGLNKYPFDGYLKNLRVSNIARYTEDFTPPIKSYNSININITNQATDQIDFTVSKLGQEVINKTEIIINNEVVQTYDEIGELSYVIDESIMNYGNNDVKIRVTFDNEYTEEVQTTYFREVELEEFEPVVNLPSTANIQDIVNRISLINSTNKAIKNNLKTLLETKGFTVGENPRLSNMVKLVNELSNNNSAEITEYINRITALESEVDNNKLELYNALVEKNLPCTQEDSFETLLSYIHELKSYTSKVYLYNEGDQCTDITGGFSDVFQYNYGSTNNTVVQYNSDHIYMKATGVNSADSFRTIYTVKSLNLESYTKLYVEYEIISISNIGAHGGIGLDTNRSFIQSGTSNIDDYEGIGITNSSLEKGVRLIKGMDISPGSTPMYPYININTNGASSYYIELKIYKLWVE